MLQKREASLAARYSHDASRKPQKLLVDLGVEPKSNSFPGWHPSYPKMAYSDSPCAEGS